MNLLDVEEVSVMDQTVDFADEDADINESNSVEVANHATKDWNKELEAACDPLSAAVSSKSG